MRLLFGYILFLCHFYQEFELIRILKNQNRLFNDKTKTKYLIKIYDPLVDKSKMVFQLQSNMKKNKQYHFNKLF